MPQKQRKSKPTAAQQRAQEALDQIAKSSSAPTKKVLEYLLAGSHSEPVSDATVRPPAITTTTEAPTKQSEKRLTQPRPNPDQTQTKPRPVDKILSSATAPAAAAPARDFNRRANSLEREALPAGVFPGASKKLYDALYLRTRGAIKPTHSIQATRRQLMLWSGIKNIKTVNVHIKKLAECGLLELIKANGDHEGAVYQVRLPEEMNPDQTQTSPNPNLDQKLVPVPDQKLVWVGLGNLVENSTTYESPKTFIKTNTDDDDAFRELAEVLSTLTKELTGTGPTALDRERWAEVGRVLADEVRKAASKTGLISSVPAFITAHLKRRFAHKPASSASAPASPEQGSTAQTIASPLTSADKRLTQEELTEHSTFVMELLQNGYTREQADEQFAASFHEDDWRQIIEAATAKLQNTIPKLSEVAANASTEQPT